MIVTLANSNPCALSTISQSTIKIMLFIYYVYLPSFIRTK